MYVIYRKCIYLAVTFCILLPREVELRLNKLGILNERRGDLWYVFDPPSSNEAINFTSSFTYEEVSRHNNAEGGYWVIIDSYVVDLSSFLRYHPAGAQKILQRRNKSIDISSNFLDHFSHTVKRFREACQEYERIQRNVVVRFPEADKGEVLIIGRVGEPK